MPLLRVTVPITIAITLLFPFTGAYSSWIMMAVGLSSAPLSIASVRFLLSYPRITTAAAGALVFANMLFLAFTKLPVPIQIKFTLVALPLLFVIPREFPRNEAQTKLSTIGRYLPFLFIFNIVSGLMYDFMAGPYAESASFRGYEVIPYCMTVMGGAWAAGRKIDLLPAMGMSCSMLSFAFLLIDIPYSVDGGMFLMQGAAGFVDVFVICLLLSFKKTNKALGMGLAAVCAGILCGKLITGQLEDHFQLYAGASNVFMTLSLAAFLFSNHRNKTTSSHDKKHDPDPEPVSEEVRQAVPNREEPTGTVLSKLPGAFEQQLSEQERLTLGCVLQGETYRSAAKTLGISESSVKTYMRRICEKMDVTGKGELLKKIRKST
jgi:DNA-binding CsgD family transcriptional regulator